MRPTDYDDVIEWGRALRRLDPENVRAGPGLALVYEQLHGVAMELKEALLKERRRSDAATLEK